MTIIHGFNALRADSAPCLLVDCQMVGAVAEERPGERHKHSPACSGIAIRHFLNVSMIVAIRR